MKIVRAGLLAFNLPLLLAATNAPPVKAPPAKAAPAKAAAKTPVKPLAKQPAKPPVKAAAAHNTKLAPKAATAQKTAPAPKPDVASSGPKVYPLLTVTFPGGVTMTEMVYRSVPGFRPLTLDLYQTSEKSFPRPGLVFVHGGNWVGGDARHNGTFDDFPAVLASIAARGTVVASVNYRLSGEARFPAALQDVKSAIRWLRGHAGDFNLDPTRVAIWGASAGGQLASMAGVSCGVAALEPPDDSRPGANDKPASDCVQAVIDWYGIVDFETMAADLGQPAPDKSIEGDYLGCEPAMCAAEVARNASPLAYIEAMSPPFLIQQGADDVTVSPKQSQALYDALRDKGVPAELVMYPGVVHGFARTNAPPGTADPATNQQAIEKLESFLDTSFPKKPATSPSAPVKPQGLPY